jgi:hypothetical protein
VLGYRFKNFIADPKSKFDELFKIFKQLITHTSGDVEEALDWFKQLDKEYELTNKDYTLDDFIAELKTKSGLQVFSIDERLTSIAAKEMIF